MFAENTIERITWLRFADLDCSISIARLHDQVKIKVLG